MQYLGHKFFSWWQKDYVDNLQEKNGKVREATVLTNKDGRKSYELSRASGCIKPLYSWNPLKET